jgi:hypothetical protein
LTESDSTFQRWTFVDNNGDGVVVSAGIEHTCPLPQCRVVLRQLTEFAKRVETLNPVPQLPLTHKILEITDTTGVIQFEYTYLGDSTLVWDYSYNKVTDNVVFQSVVAHEMPWSDFKEWHRSYQEFIRLADLV